MATEGALAEAPAPDLGDYARFVSPTPSPSPQPDPTPDLGDYGQFVSPAPPPSDDLGDYAQFTSPTPHSDNVVAQTHSVADQVDASNPFILQSPNQIDAGDVKIVRDQGAMVTIPKATITQDEPTIVKGAKAAYNTAAGFAEGTTSADGLNMLLNPVAGIAGIASMVPGLINRVQEAEQTPPNSPERWQAAADVTAFLALPAVAHGISKIKGGAPVTPDAPQPQPVVPNDLRPALRTQTGVTVGELGQEHADLYPKLSDAELEDLLNGTPPEHGFVHANDPQNFLDRARGSAALGETEPLSSQRLKELQGTPAPEVDFMGTSQPETEGGANVPEAAPSDLAGGAALPDSGPMSIGAASREEFMRRYALIGAESILKNGLDPAKFQQAVETQFGSHIRPMIPDVMERSKALLNEFETGTGKSDVAREINRQIGITKARETPVLVRPTSSLKAGLAAQEKAGEAGYRRGLKEARTEAKANAAQIKGDLMMGDKFMAGDVEQVRKNMIDYAKATLPRTEIGAFVNRITQAMKRPALGKDPAVMYRKAFEVMRDMEAKAEVLYKKSVIADINKQFDRWSESPSVDVAYRRQMVETTKNLSLKDMPINALEQLRTKIEELISSGRDEVKSQQAINEAEINRMVGELNNAKSTPMNKRPLLRRQPTDGDLSFYQKFSNLVNRTINGKDVTEQVIAPMDEIADHMDGSTGTYDGWVSTNIKGKGDLAFNEALADFDPISRESKGIIKKNGLTVKDLETVGLKQIMDNIGRDRLDAMQIRKDILDRVENTPLTPGQQAYYDFARKTYDSLGPRVRDTAHALYQKDITLDPKYVPLIRDWYEFYDAAKVEPSDAVLGGEEFYNEKSVMSQLQRDMNPKAISRTEQGFLKDRIEGARGAVKVDAEDLLLRHTRDALHFVHAQPVIKQIFDVVKRPEFAAKYGEEGQVIIMDYLDTMATQGAVNPMQRIRFLDWVKNSTSKAAVAFRLSSNIVHSSQLPFAAIHAGDPAGRWLTSGARLSFGREGQEFVNRFAPELVHRAGGEPAQAEVESFSKYGKAGFLIARNLDRTLATWTFLGRYAKEMQKQHGIAPGDALSAPVDKDILGLALRRAHRAVASPFPKDVPQLMSRGKGIGNISVAKMLTQFRNIFFDIYSAVRHDFFRVGAQEMKTAGESFKRGEIRKGAVEASKSVYNRTAIAAAFMASTALETGIKMYVPKLISMATGGDRTKDQMDFEKQFEHHLLNRIPGVGQFMSMFLYGDTGIPLIDAVVKPAHELGIAFKSKHPSTVARHEIRALSGLASLLGIYGSGQVLDILEGYVAPPEPQGATTVPLKSPKKPRKSL